MVEINELKPFVIFLVLTGLITGAGILTLDKFTSADAVSSKVDVTDESVTWVKIGGTLTLSNGNVTALSIENTTGSVLDSSNYSLSSVNGVVTVLDNTTGCRSGVACNASYTYKNYATPAATALGSTNSAIGDIPNTWLSLIITVMVLGLIVFLIIRSFGGR